MKRNNAFLLLAIFYIFSVGQVIAQGANAATAKKDSIAIKAVARSKTNTSSKKKAIAKTDSLKPIALKLPRLVDLGAGKCIPCKMMAPILDEMKKDFVGKLEVVFIDVWKNADEGSKYKIRVIPTQIFYSPEGKELFRHEGFYAKEDILAKWIELGYEIKK